MVVTTNGMERRDLAMLRPGTAAEPHTQVIQSKECNRMQQNVTPAKLIHGASALGTDWRMQRGGQRWGPMAKALPYRKSQPRA